MIGLRFFDDPFVPDARFDTYRREFGDKFEAMLKRYRVVVFGRRATSKQIIFSVKTAQADWAEYLLQREGANVVSLFNRNNARWAAKHNGIMPTPWDELKRK